MHENSWGKVASWTCSVSLDEDLQMHKLRSLDQFKQMSFIARQCMVHCFGSGHIGESALSGDDYEKLEMKLRSFFVGYSKIRWDIRIRAKP